MGKEILPSIPEGIGIEISSILSDYNHSLVGDQHDASLALLQDFCAEGVLQ